MNNKYTVEQYAITRKGDGWDDQSARDSVGFETLEDAEKAFDGVDVRGQWITEKNCSNLTLVKHEVMAVELCKNELDDDGEVVDSEIVKYKEYGLSDYETEQ